MDEKTFHKSDIFHSIAPNRTLEILGSKLYQRHTLTTKFVPSVDIFEVNESENLLVQLIDFPKQKHSARSCVFLSTGFQSNFN